MDTQPFHMGGGGWGSIHMVSRNLSLIGLSTTLHAYTHINKTFQNIKCLKERKGKGPAGSHYCVYEIPLLLRAVIADGMQNAFLWIAFLANGTLYCLPDGRRLNE